MAKVANRSTTSEYQPAPPFYTLKTRVLATAAVPCPPTA